MKILFYGKVNYWIYDSLLRDRMQLRRSEKYVYPRRAGSFNDTNGVFCVLSGVFFRGSTGFCGLQDPRCA